MIADQGWDLHLFPINSLPALSEFRNITVHQPWITVGRQALLQAAKKRIRRYVFNIKEDPAQTAGAATERAIYPVPMLGRHARIANGFKTSLGFWARKPLSFMDLGCWRG